VPHVESTYYPPTALVLSTSGTKSASTALSTWLAMFTYRCVVA